MFENAFLRWSSDKVQHRNERIEPESGRSNGKRIRNTYFRREKSEQHAGKLVKTFSNARVPFHG